MDLVGLFPEEITTWLETRQIASFRADQIFTWLHKHAAQSFQEMTNLPSSLMTELEETFQSPWPIELVASRKSADGTEKYLFALNDDATIEAVLIPEEDRQTLCISTQVGCAMACSFCATGQSGYVRNLWASEIVAQVLWVENRLRAKGQNVSNIVYMGMGEPLANYDALLRSVRLLNHEKGLNLGARRLTISTCGLAPQIKALAEEDIQVNLAISLHATTDAERSQVMPVNKRFPLQELLEACEYYTEKTGRRISYEYALIRGFNDTVDQAKRLKRLLKGRLCHVNLIPINPVGPEKRPSAKVLTEFAQVLKAGGIPVSIRKERGTDIEAACGQLRQTHLQE
ncbi:MAG TPA: 23S rRNA (adenine(2503)-C(2))-methyltransferase RlmN [Firmicutes bacterium]|nr:23S rRNA (adenine(2503)-C(2))-methyltransferase RlmN [Bacillota bacterium]